MYKRQVADGVDVINYSIGGGAATVAADTLAFLFAADAGVYSAVSAGNSGPGAKTIGGPADVPWVTSVGANTQPTFYQGTIEAGGKRYLGASVPKGVGPAKFVHAAAPGRELCLEGQLNPAKVAGAIVLCKRGGKGRVAKSAEVLRAGGVGMVLFNAVDVDTLFSDTFFVPTVMIDFTPGTQLKAWIAGTPNPVGRLVSGGIDVYKRQRLGSLPRRASTALTLRATWPSPVMSSTRAADCSCRAAPPRNPPSPGCSPTRCAAIRARVSHFPTRYAVGLAPSSASISRGGRSGSCCPVSPIAPR